MSVPWGGELFGEVNFISELHLNWVYYLYYLITWKQLKENKIGRKKLNKFVQNISTFSILELDGARTNLPIDPCL